MSDVIIIGAGPAGISAALYTIRSGLETTVIAAGDSALAKAEKSKTITALPNRLAEKSF